MAGIGLSSAVQLAPSAFLASAAGCVALVADILPRDNQGADDHTISAVQHWCSLSEAEIDNAISHPGVQKQWTSAVNKKKLERLQESAETETCSARIKAHQGKTAGAWLNAYPSRALGLKLTDDQARISLGLRLGGKTCEPHTCCCGSTVQKDGLHGLACKRSAGRHPRHSMLNDIVKRALATAGLPSQLEPVGLTRSDGKRADGVTLIPWTRGDCLAWDVTAVDALAPSNVTRSASTPSSAATAAEERKTAKYEELVSRGYIFQPVAFEVQGRPGPSTENFLNTLGAKLKLATHNKKAHSQLLQRLSVAIQIGNAACVMGTMPQHSREELEQE
jgi:hypothetical protein